MKLTNQRQIYNWLKLVTQNRTDDGGEYEWFQWYNANQETIRFSREEAYRFIKEIEFKESFIKEINNVRKD